MIKETTAMARRMAALCAWTFCAVAGSAQTAADSAAMRARLYNKEYEVSMHISLYDKDVVVPGQELFGPLPGYLQKDRNSFCWMIVDAEVTAPGRALLTIINDYGSDDLQAELICKGDSIYTLRHLSGATLKVPQNGKWQKLPKTFDLKLKK